MPVADTRWDEYYKPLDHKASTPLRYILNNKSLKRAYYLMIFGLLIYILFEGKRKQRIILGYKTIKKHKPGIYRERLAGFTFRKARIKALPKKRIRYLFDYIRTNFKVNATDMQGEFYESLSAKTLISIGELKELFTYIISVKNQPILDSLTLLKLNTMIEDFYKKTN